MDIRAAVAIDYDGIAPVVDLVISAGAPLQELTADLVVSGLASERDARLLAVNIGHGPLPAEFIVK